MRRRPEKNLSFDQVHLIRTSGLSSDKLAAQMGINPCTVRRARHGHTHGDHPTPPVRLERGGWKKAQPPAVFPESIALSGEEWRPVVGWEKYYRVSNFGRLYSLHQSGRLVLGMPMDHGYRVLKVRDKERRGHLATHCMVLEAFVGPRPSEIHEGCHNDGNPENCHVDNLRWDTPKGNAADRVRHGTSMRGKPAVIKLTPELVREIRTSGLTDAYWMKRLGMTRTSIHSARTGKTWPEVETPPDIRRRFPGGRYQLKEALRSLQRSQISAGAPTNE
jgi:hypothetical protein